MGLLKKCVGPGKVLFSSACVSILPWILSVFCLALCFCLFVFKQN